MRHSPIHHLLEAQGAQWGRIGGAPISLRFGSAKVEQETVRTLGLCDVSALPKLGVKGPEAETWLGEQGVKVPVEIYESADLDDDGRIVRLGADEFLLESGIACRSVPELAERLGSARGSAVLVRREEATFLLTGERSLEVLAQTCGLDFREPVARRLVMTRIAGVSCGILPDSVGDVPIYRLWVDCSFAQYLWETLAGICSELGGNVVGAACLYPDF